LLYQVSGRSRCARADGQGTTKYCKNSDLGGFWTLGGGVLVAGLLAMTSPGFATEQAQERREGRDEHCA